MPSTLCRSHSRLSGDPEGRRWSAVVLWAFGTWLIPLLGVFSVGRHVWHRGLCSSYAPALWSMVFPLGMYAAASMDLGGVAHLPVVVGIGRAWAWLAVGVWAIVFIAMCRHLLGGIRRFRRRPTG